MTKKLFFIAGEASGDLHGAHLINSLQKKVPSIKTYAIGGPQMREAGAEIFEDLTDIAVVGFYEIIKGLKRFKSAYRLAINKIDQIKPDAVILIDYPGFNLRIAQEIKKRNIPVIYYISPQVWAWGKKRIEFIKKTIDLMIVVFKFEEELYKARDINVKFSGHPLVDMVKPDEYDEAIYKKHNIDKSKKIITLLPGSRINEISKILPAMLEIAGVIHNKNKDIQFIILKSPNISNSVYEKIMDCRNYPVRLIEADNYNLLNIADFAIVCSGTATLETALLQVPMVIVYKINPISWLVIKNLIKIPCIGLVNIVAGKKIVPEYIQYDIKPGYIASYILEVLSNTNISKSIKSDLCKVKQLLGSPGGSSKAADFIIDFISKKA
jgi:lipid-A-disaccharide synthase